MPNICSYLMKATGPSQGLKRLYNALTVNYEYTEEDPEHFWRIFDTTVGEVVQVKGDIYSVNFLGSCAWSVWSCMFDGPFTYQKDDTTGAGTHIVKLSKEENLVVEIYSQEPGLSFSEHFLVVNGEILIQGEEEYYEFDSEVDPDTLLKYGGLHWTQEQINNYFKREDTLIICKYDWIFTDHTEYYKGETDND